MKNKWINIRCTEEERAEINEQAKKHKMKVSRFIIWLIEKEMESGKDA